MKNIVLQVGLVCLFLFSCASDTEDIANEYVVNKATNRQTTGSSSNDLLSASTFKKMIVEIACVEGFQPTDAALNTFKNFIESRTYKPEGIVFTTKQIPATGKTSYTIDEIAAIEKTNRTEYNTATTIAVWVLFVNGHSSNDSNASSVLGTAYWNTSFVIYEETIQGLSDGVFDPERSLLESSVMHHEFGHILGLTNLGADLQSDHEDSEHEKHCKVENCLMYWAAESSQGMGNLFSEGEIPTLDALCLQDLKANGGK